MNKIWLTIMNKDEHFTYTKYFDTEFEKDKYKERIKYVPCLMVIEDSTDIYYFTD